MLPVLFGDTCDWRWNQDPTVKHRKKRRREKFLHFLSSFLKLYVPFLNGAAFPLHGAGWKSELPQCGSVGPGWAEEEGLRGATSRSEGGWRKEVRWGFALTFASAPQLMLRCCHFHHLKCCHFRCRSLVFMVSSEGGGGSLGRFPF